MPPEHGIEDVIACWACGGASVEMSGAPAAYRRCPRCELVFSERESRPAYDDTYFAGYAGGGYLATEAVRRHESRVRLAWMERHGATPPGRLLEIGSAAGFFLDEASARGWAPEGIEPFETLASLARRRFGVPVRSGFVEDVTLERRSVDSMCLWHTLEHVPRPAPTLVGLFQALRPGGTLFLEVPNWRSRMAQRRTWNWHALEPDVHVAQFGPRSLDLLLRRAGFTGIHLETVPFLTYVEGRLRRAPRRVLLAARQRAWLRDPHPAAHELLRAAARAPGTDVAP